MAAATAFTAVLPEAGLTPSTTQWKFFANSSVGVTHLPTSEEEEGSMTISSVREGGGPKVHSTGRAACRWAE